MPVNALLQLADSYAYLKIHLKCPLLQEVSLGCSKQILNSSCGAHSSHAFSTLASTTLAMMLSLPHQKGGSPGWSPGLIHLLGRSGSNFHLLKKLRFTELTTSTLLQGRRTQCSQSLPSSGLSLLLQEVGHYQLTPWSEP